MPFDIVLKTPLRQTATLSSDVGNVDLGRTVALPEQGRRTAVATTKQPLRDQPPEVLMHRTFSARSDTFSLGTRTPARVPCVSCQPGRL